MKNFLFEQTGIKNISKFVFWGLILLVIQVSISKTSYAQAENLKTTEVKNETNFALPKVTQIDLIAFKELLKREGENPKPLLVNFWATWCDPCRAEFPDLVKINAEYKGVIDFVTVSLDELSEIDRDVPKFLNEMKATMPAYLLKTNDEESAISAVSKDWSGGLPFTILINGKGELVYTRQGKIKPDILRMELDKLIEIKTASQITNQSNLELPNPRAEYTYEKGKSDAQKDIADGKFIIRTYGMTPGSKQNTSEMKEKYGIEIFDDSIKPVEYLKGYNEISKMEIKRKFGLEF